MSSKNEKNRQVREFSAEEKSWFWKALKGKKVYGIWPEEEKEIVAKYAGEELARQKAEGLIPEDADKISIAAAAARRPRLRQRIISYIVMIGLILILAISVVVCIGLSRGWELPQFLNF